MASIPRVFHTLEKRVMSLSEFENYLYLHQYKVSLRNIICVEYGDEIVYADGPKISAYFKHAPSCGGHAYCSLYSVGHASNSQPSILRKTLFMEVDIICLLLYNSLNLSI